MPACFLKELFRQALAQVPPPPGSLPYPAVLTPSAPSAPLLSSELLTEHTGALWCLDVCSEAE